MTSKILVLGGSGFLGKHICLAGLKAGYKVTSISRTGEPNISRSSFPASALPLISWKKGDVFDVNTYMDEFEDSAAVVHSMGTIFADTGYKKFTSQMNSFVGLPKFLAGQIIGANPLAGNAFDYINRKSAVVLATAYSDYLSSLDKEIKRPFIYISAENWNSLSDPRYIESKRAAERDIDSLHNLRGVYLRPGFMYSEECNIKDVRHIAGRVINALKSGVNNRIPSALSVQSVAESAIEAVRDDTISGPVPLEALTKYAELLKNQRHSEAEES